MPERFAISAGTVVPMNAPPIKDGAVIVSGETIEKVVARTEIPDGIPVEEHPDGILLPAFVNAHTHLVYTLFRGVADDAPFFNWLNEHIIPLGIEKKEEECREGAGLAIDRCFRLGITCLGESHFTQWGWETMSGKGMKGVYFGEIFGIRSDDLAESVEKEREKIELLAEDATEKLRIGIAPHAPYSVPPPMARMAAEVSEKYKLHISIHVAETHDEVRFFRHGTGPFGPVRFLARFPKPDGSQTPLSYLDDHGLLTERTLLIHGVHLSDADLKIIAERGCTLVTCPTSNAKIGAGIARVSAWKSHGIPFCIATDSVASGESFDLFEEMRRFALLQRGLSGETDTYKAVEIICAVTVIPAKALGMEKLVGDMAEGTSADLMLIEPDLTGVSRNRNVFQTILWGTNSSDIVAVWSDGREVYRR